MHTIYFNFTIVLRWCHVRMYISRRGLQDTNHLLLPRGSVLTEPH